MITKTYTGQVEFASFVFNIKTGFALIVRFNFLGKDPFGMDHYFTDNINLRKILDYLNKDKTGINQESIDTCDLDKLVGKKAVILCDEETGDCFFGKWIDL